MLWIIQRTQPTSDWGLFTRGVQGASVHLNEITFNAAISAMLGQEVGPADLIIPQWVGMHDSQLPTDGRLMQTSRSRRRRTW
jgi:hypothetical protein